VTVPPERQPFDGGPYLKAALICERMLEEKDNVLTPVRIIDRINVQARGAEAPETMPAGNIEFVIFTCLVAGEARGPVRLTLRIEPPSVVDSRVLWDGTFDFTAGPDQAHNLILKTRIEARSAGLYWIDALIEGRRITRMPLRVSYSRMSTP
jgi:hypothetical protein